ncbi:hypothetical protein IHV12_20910 [Fictibacillus sp. 7GRE50]|uniref:hypothetical protein n=1 Tax=Fictibacillus sp. 7GRE50 TaxID=2745878 RepID=UPI0018CDB0CB|nr:hypothetical protein [Fictibacillus sp. 7GRE50]MBH0167391.1 hypothetical protein [Fictibacillus sp. 7GRE50]
MVYLTFDLKGLATATRQMRHLYVKRKNVAHRLPRGKRSTGTEINYFHQQQSVINEFKIKNTLQKESVFIKE